MYKIIVKFSNLILMATVNGVVIMFKRCHLPTQGFTQRSRCQPRQP